MTSPKKAMNGSDSPADHFTASALTASLTVTDLPASLAWYRDVVGFRLTISSERPPET